MDRDPRGVGLAQQIPDQARAETAAAKGGEEGDVDQGDVLGGTIGDDAPDRRVAALDDVRARRG